MLQDFEIGLVLHSLAPQGFGVERLLPEQFSPLKQNEKMAARIVSIDCCL